MVVRKPRLDLDGATAQITVFNHIVGCLDIGLGWNDSSCLDGRWPEIRAAGFEGYSWPFRRRFSQEDWDRYFGLMEWSGCHWIRHAVSVSDWETATGNGSRSNKNHTVYAFDSEAMKRHYLVLDQAEKRGMKVLLANWNMGVDRPSEPGAEYRHPKSEEGFAEALAALIYHLKYERNYKCVWALSLWNEPDNRSGYTGPEADYPHSFWPLYEAVDRHLRRLAVRDEIRLLGPDTTTGGRPQHIVRMLEAHGPILDIVADHDYAAFRGKAMFRSVVSYEWLMQNLRQTYNGRVPFVISEFGNYGGGPGPVNDDTKVYDGALSTTAYLIRMINSGVAGLARWEFSIYGNDWRNFGALTNADGAYHFRPYDPVYYPHAITARYIRPGWDVRQVRVDDGGDGLWVTALTSNLGDLTLILLNDDIKPQSARLTLNLEFAAGQLHHLKVSPPVSDGIVRSEDLPIEKNGMRVSLPPQSITVLTTLPPGNLARPMELASRRTGQDEFYNLLNRQLHFVRKRAGSVRRYFRGK